MTSTPAQRTRHAPLRGIGLVIMAVLLFAVMDTVSKHLIGQFNVPLVSSVRYTLNLVLLAALVLPRHGAKLWQTRRTGLVMLRGAALAFATLLAGFAFQRMPVGETIAIIYLQGFGVMIAAKFFLGERLSPFGWGAAAVGFVGVLLIARPGGALDPLGVALALGCAAISVIYILLSRVLAASESTMAMLLHVAIAGMALFGILLPFNWKNFDFTAIDVALLAFLGSASLAGHFLLTSAYRFAPASMLAPFNYFHIAFAVLFGGIAYQHVPDGWALAGMAMVGASGAAVAIHTHMTKPARN